MTEGGPSRGRQAVAQDDDGAGANSLKGTFTDKLIPMMYGFGDDKDPLAETVDLVEDIVINYSNGLLRMALDVAAARGRVKPGKSAPGAVVTPDDIAALVRRDPKKITRLKEILSLQEEIAKARQGLEEAVDPAAFVGLNK